MATITAEARTVKSTISSADLLRSVSCCYFAATATTARRHFADGSTPARLKVAIARIRQSARAIARVARRHAGAVTNALRW